MQEGEKKKERWRNHIKLNNRKLKKNSLFVKIQKNKNKTFMKYYYVEVMPDALDVLDAEEYSLDKVPSGVVPFDLYPSK